MFTVKCRQLLEECQLDVNTSAIVTQSKQTSVRAVEVLVNLYLLHVDANDITPIIDGLIHYSLKIFLRVDRHRRDTNDTIDDDTSDNAIVDLSTWNMKTTFIVYFRCLFKHFLIKARSIKLPNESKKKQELEQICTDWLELNELFRKFVSFVTIDKIYKNNVVVSQSIYLDYILSRSNIHSIISFLQGYIHCSSLFKTIYRHISSSCYANIRSLLFV
jgi:hypothetical protein